MAASAVSSVLVAARNEEERIGATVAQLRQDFPAAEVIVVVGGTTDETAERAEEAGAVVIRLNQPGKGEALTAGERAATPGPLLLCDADLRGSLAPLTESDADLAVAVFEHRAGGGFGVAKRVAGTLIRLRTGFHPREPLSGQRYLSEQARIACFPVAGGFGCETRMTIDALRAGLRLEEIVLDLGHRATTRNAAGFAHRGRQLVDAVLAAGPLGVNHRGVRLPLLGWAVALPGLFAPRRTGVPVALIAAIGLADDLWSGPERGFAGHLRSRRTTGILKLVGIPAVAAVATRSLRGALVVSLSANALNQLDTKPGRALKAFLGVSLFRGLPEGGYALMAILLVPYDLRERMMLGDAGSNALGAVLGLSLVASLRGRALWPAIAVFAALNVLGERRSLGKLIESTPWLERLDRLGRRG
ncbi:MAG TPA: glycosyltransferase [Gaiellaceae bacterium]|nr:glycosyltransferase [Gaiellaceae bacterium]